MLGKTSTWILFRRGGGAEVFFFFHVTFDTTYSLSAFQRLFAVMGEKIASSSDALERNDPLSKPAHSLPCDLVVGELGSKIDEGLSTDEAARRLQKYGPNKLEDGAGISILKILVAQVANAMMLVKPTISCWLETNTRI